MFYLKEVTCKVILHGSIEYLLEGYLNSKHEERCGTFQPGLSSHAGMWVITLRNGQFGDSRQLGCLGVSAKSISYSTFGVRSDEGWDP